MLNDAKIIDTWFKNAQPWTDAVREGRIESRELVTDRAIVEAVVDCAPRSVLDIGCGEGWLVRALASHGMDVTGVDVVPGLIARATRAGGGRFIETSYEDIAAQKLHVQVDVAVCNFSLLGKESVEGMLRAVPSLLAPGGFLLIQTLHPVAACGDRPYEDGWREGSWAGFSEDFVDPAPWYFRTLGSWLRLLRDSRLALQEMREPLHPVSRQPASVVFIARRREAGIG